MVNGKNKEISTGLVCVHSSAPEHLQQRSQETIIDHTRNQLKEILVLPVPSQQAFEELAARLHETADVLRVADSAEAYRSFCASNMKLADEYVSERPSLMEHFDKARSHVLAAAYTRNLENNEEEMSVVGRITRGYEEAKTVTRDTALDNNDMLRAQIAHLKILHEVSTQHARFEGYAPVPAILAEQMLRTEGDLRFCSDVSTYQQAAELIHSVRTQWGFEDSRTTRETVMAIHPSSQRQKPKIIRIPSGHDAIAEAPNSDNKAQQSAQALGRLSEDVRALSRKPPRYL